LGHGRKKKWKGLTRTNPMPLRVSLSGHRHLFEFHAIERGIDEDDSLHTIPGLAGAGFRRNDTPVTVLLNLRLDVADGGAEVTAVET